MNHLESGILIFDSPSDISPKIMGQLFSSTLIGVWCHNFLSEYEINKVVSEYFQHIEESPTLPIDYSKVTALEDLKIRANSIGVSNKYLDDVLLKKIHLCLCNNDINIKTENIPQLNIPIPIATVRTIQEGGARIGYHCENTSIEKFKLYFDLINQWASPIDMLSCVIMLKPSAVGGELVIYDLEWDSSVHEDKQYAQIAELESIGVGNIKKRLFKLEAGDLFIFHAGRYWHSVNAVVESARVTCGGFLAKANRIPKHYYLFS